MSNGQVPSGLSARDDASRFYQEAAQHQPHPADTAAYKHTDALAYEISQVPMRTRRPLKIICCGGGISGLNIAHEVQSGSFANCSLTIYEKNSDIGGTWFENRYPGCACDIPIHNYQFSWAPFPQFPSFYTGGEHIYEYLKEVAQQYDLAKYIKVSHKITSAQWNEERQKWLVRIVQTDGRELVVSDGKSQDGEQGDSFVEECDVFINASGAYNNWRWPTIPNRESFQGNMMHSAVWPKDDHISGKTVSLIGNGSSGIQILPTILDQADKIYLLLRSRTWVTPALANRFAGENGANKIYTDEEKDHWTQHPEEYHAYRKEIEHELNVRFRLYIKGSKAQDMGREGTKKQMTARLASKPELVKDLIPEFPVGCRRPTPGSGFLEALCSPKVEIVWGDIDTFNETGIKTTSGRQIDSDTIICATGFNMGFVPRFSIVGSSGLDLREVWQKELPAAYLSTAVKNMPNFFVMMGPQSPLGHGSITGSVEHVTKYIGRFIEKLQTEAYSSVVPKEIVSEAWLAHAMKWMEKTVWVENCASSFKNGESGRTVISLHPGSRLHYFDLLEHPRFEDFEWTSLLKDPTSMFAWLADGFTAAETIGESDLSYYLEDAPHLKVRNKRTRDIASTESELDSGVHVKTAA